MSESEPFQTAETSKWKPRLNAFYNRIKSLQGDPHYVAIGMASGIFVSVTPTVPFHMALALAFAFVLKGSKPAAVLGSWLCNPLTIAPFYYGSYHFGMLLLDREIIVELHTTSFIDLMALGADVAIAMVLGGALLGIIPAAMAYYFTFQMFSKIRARRKQSHHAESAVDPNLPGDDALSQGANAEKKQTP